MVLQSSTSNIILSWCQSFFVLCAVSVPMSQASKKSIACIKISIPQAVLRHKMKTLVLPNRGITSQVSFHVSFSFFILLEMWS